MNWDDVRIFLAVARAGQILGAARRLGLNHATVSRRMSALEDALGVKLVDRQTTGTELTPEGERFLATAEAMEAGMIAARAELAPDQAAVSGTVRIGAPDGFGVAWLAPRLGRLTSLHPGLTIQLVPVPRSFSLSRREADIAITMERPEEGRLVAGKLVDYTLGLYAASSYVDENGLPLSAEAVTNHSLVGYVPDLVISPALDYAGEIAPDWRSTFEISSALGQMEAVRAGAGLGILHTFLARRHEDLVPVPGFPLIRRAYWIVYHETLKPLRHIQAVVRFIQDEVEAARSTFV
ncbi:MAG: LysR family transcriptional regulator [Zhengella sp.]|uniref:LysR family transcriptional regulator n=1 Tax=Zhengella sp. TaxID=2282762 RepID=UPI001D2C1AF7|nr:LysR family transcriptional regulator [Notoacmeibacter sp.]MCC0027698.1 LysR family transcriptional regulator [Brucellaceae bacterium]